MFQALRMDLGHGMIQNPAAEVTEVVEYLVACEKTLASLYTLADCLISWQVSCFFCTANYRLKRRCFSPGTKWCYCYLVGAVLDPEKYVTHSARTPLASKHKHNNMFLYA